MGALSSSGCLFSKSLDWNDIVVYCCASTSFRVMHMSKMKEQYTVQLEPEFVEKLDKIADDVV